MADTIFFLDDTDEQEMGGFNDPPISIEEAPDKEAGVEPDKDEPKPDADPSPDQDPDPDKEADPKPDPVEEDPKPEVKPAFDPDAAIAMIAKQNEQIASQAAMIQKMSEPKVEPEQLTPPEKPVFTNNQWDDDPEGCNEALWNYRDEEKAFNKKVAAGETEAKTEADTAATQAAHKESWDLSVDVMPELAGDERARQAWSTIFNNPETGFANDPNGPLKATRALKNFMKEKNLSFGDPPAETKPDSGPDPAEAKKEGAADEAARQNRVKKQGMHTGGKGAGNKAVQLTDAQKNHCRQKNISEELFASTLAAMEISNVKK